MPETQLPVSGFVVQYQVYSDAKAQGQRADQRRHTADKGGDVFEEVKISNPKKKSASIKGLQPSTPYTVRMFSYNKEGKSALSNSAVASTLPGRFIGWVVEWFIDWIEWSVEWFEWLICWNSWLIEWGSLLNEMVGCNSRLNEIVAQSWWSIELNWKNKLL